MATDAEREELWDLRGVANQLREINADLLAALEACVQVLAVQYQTRLRNGGAGQQAFDRGRAAIAKAREEGR